MNPVETQVAEYFAWLDSEAREHEPVQLRNATKTSRSGRALMLAVAAAVIAVVIGLSVVVYRQDDVAPRLSPSAPSTITEQSTDPTALSAELRSTELAMVLSDAGVDMSRLPDTVLDAITDIASGADQLCGFESRLSPENETGIRLNSPARRCFLDSYLIGSPAVLVRQGPTYLNAPGIFIWRTQSDRSVTIDAARQRVPDGPDDGWSSEQCGGISTDSGSSADPPESINCGGFPLSLIAEKSDAPAWFVDRTPLSLCGYSMPSSEDESGAACLADALAQGRPAEYVVAASDGRSVAWMRSLDIGLYERIDWRVSVDGLPSWSQSRCTRSDTRDATIPVFGGTDSYSCEPT